MSDENALAVEKQAENQAAGAPDSGGKPGEGAEDFRQLVASCQEVVDRLVERMDGQAIGQVQLEGYLDELKVRVEKLAALDVANAFQQIDWLRRDLGHAVARINALEAPKAERLATAQDDHDFCARAESATRHVGLFAVPTTREGWLAWAREAQRVAAEVLGVSFHGLDRSIRPAAEVARENSGGITAEDFRRAAEKVEPGRLVQPFERQAAAEYAALPFPERSGVAYRAEREAMRQVGRPCPKVGCQGILAKDYAGGPAWCPECRRGEAEVAG